MPTRTLDQAAALAQHLATIDRHLPAGADGVILSRSDVTELRTAVAAFCAELSDGGTHAGRTATDAPAADTIAPDLLRDMQRIATGYRGLAYDPDDRPEEVAAVIAAARAAGLVPVPDPTCIRSYRGCTPPAPDPAAAVLAAEAAGYQWTPTTVGTVDDVLAVLATTVRPLLDALYAAGQRNPTGGDR